jgi:hypothetical protein
LAARASPQNLDAEGMPEGLAVRARCAVKEKATWMKRSGRGGISLIVHVASRPKDALSLPEA